MGDRLEDVEDRLRRRTRQMESLADLGQRALEGVGLSALAEQACACLTEDVDASWCAVLEPYEGSLVQRGEPPAWGADLVHLAATEGRTEIDDDRIVLPIQGLGVVAVAAPRGGTLSRQDLYFVRTVAHLLGAAGQREQHERALRAASERVDQALRASRAGAWESDLQRRRYYWSPEMRQLLGLRDDEVPSEALWQELLHPEDRERAHRASRDVVEAGADLDLEVRVVRRDGAHRWLRSIGKVVTDAEGRSERMFGILVDVTASKEAEIARAWAEHRSAVTRRMESLGRLAGGVAHDFNNLLTVVIGGADLVLGDLQDPTARALLEQVREAGLRGSELIRQLLDFGRPDADRAEVIDVRERVEGLRSLLCRVLGEVVRLEMRQVEQPLPVEIAPGRLDQVLINLCVNARDAMPAGGRLEVVTEERVVDDAGGQIAPGRWVVLSVRDEGEGMTPEQAARVFEPFYTTKPAGEGTGLGLASVYGIVTGRGGQIRVDTAPGKGTTFEIWLPRSSGQPRAHEPSPTTAFHRAPSDALHTVLVVEDEPAVRDLVRCCLEGDGLRVVEAVDGVDALRVLATHPGRIDLVITDVVMPHLDGPGLVRRARATRPDLPVLYLTGYAGDAGGQGFLGDDRVLSKPFAYRDLISAAQDLLGEAAKTLPAEMAPPRRRA